MASSSYQIVHFYTQLHENMTRQVVLLNQAQLLHDVGLFWNYEL